MESITSILQAIGAPKWAFWAQFIIVIGAIFVVVLWKIFNFVKDANNVNLDVKDLKKDMGEVKSELKNIKDVFNLLIVGESKSPLKLKDQFKKPVLESTVKNQIDSKLDEFIQEIKSMNPKTKLDAQDIIKDKTENWIKQFDLADFKNKLYEAGGTEDLVVSVIALYLQELIVPRL